MAHLRKQCVTLLMTSECNLDCTYCYLRDCRPREIQSIDLDFAKQGIQDFFSSSVVHIRRRDIANALVIPPLVIELDKLHP